MFFGGRRTVCASVWVKRATKTESVGKQLCFDKVPFPPSTATVCSLSHIVDSRTFSTFYRGPNFLLSLCICVYLASLLWLCMLCVQHIEWEATVCASFIMLVPAFSCTNAFAWHCRQNSDFPSCFIFLLFCWRWAFSVELKCCLIFLTHGNALVGNAKSYALRFLSGFDNGWKIDSDPVLSFTLGRFFFHLSIFQLLQTL